jgi:hypothetical protein
VWLDRYDVVGFKPQVYIAMPVKLGLRSDVWRSMLVFISMRRPYLFPSRGFNNNIDLIIVMIIIVKIQICCSTVQAI